MSTCSNGLLKNFNYFVLIKVAKGPQEGFQPWAKKVRPRDKCMILLRSYDDVDDDNIKSQQLIT